MDRGDIEAGLLAGLPVFRFEYDGHDASDPLRRLILLNAGVEPSEKRGSAFLNPHREPTRAIGEEFNQIGGFDCMLAAFNFLKTFLSPAAMRELEFAWDGIGGWQA
jgi:hypothetical protein